MKAKFPREFLDKKVNSNYGQGTLMKLYIAEKYQLHTILNTYDIYEDNQQVRDLLNEAWAIKLKGYKKYFPYGVLPIDKHDFIANHIIVSDKESGKVVMAIKSLPLSNCRKCNIPFPAKSHLLNGKENIYSDHAKAIDNWIDSKFPQDVAYSSSFTIDPSLEKKEKRLLTDIVFYLFPYFYKQYNIQNVIHGINKRNKLDLRQQEIGFKILTHENKALPHIELENYDDVQCDVMVVDNLEFNPKYIEKASIISKLWDEKEEFIGIADEDQKQVA